MQETSSNNKRIVKNTAVLYIRMLFTMAIGLYTSRVVLKVLGVEDYGVYNVVGGIVGMLAFLNSTMSSATSRFLTFELGRGDKNRLGDTFNAAFIIHHVIALLVVFIVETVGLWFLYNKLVIPDERMTAAFWVLQFSIISSFFGITQVPYNACIIAHEKLDVFAYIQILESILKLLVVYLITLVNYDKLITYAFLYLIVSILIRCIYRWYAIRHFEESHFRFKTSREIVKPMLSFSSWDILGHFGYTFRLQGCNMVLNMFFGTVVNAAGGIASTVQGTLLNFSNNITTAVKPQIIKRYSMGNKVSMVNLLISSIRLNLFMILLVTIPTIIEIPYLLSLWLIDVPEHCVIFCQIALCANILTSYSQLIYICIQASGDLRRTSINRNIIYISTPFVLYGLYRFGTFSPALAYFLLFGGQLLQSVLDINVLRHKISELNVKELYFDFLKVSVIVLFVMIICIGLHRIIFSDFVSLIVVYLASTIFLVLLFYAIVFKQQEKDYIKTQLLKRFHGKFHS